jgi:hypothetical protein
MMAERRPSVVVVAVLKPPPTSERLPYMAVITFSDTKELRDR